jgi:hypothetical protein
MRLELCASPSTSNTPAVICGTDYLLQRQVGQVDSISAILTSAGCAMR